MSNIEISMSPREESVEDLPVLLITRGISNSGKTTWAKKWVAEDPANRRRVNRDDIRAALFNRAACSFEQEQIVTMAQRAAVINHLSEGRSVVVDDTHLVRKFVKSWFLLSRELGVRFEVKDDFYVTLEEALRRNAERAKNGGVDVPEHVIRKMFTKGTVDGVPRKLGDLSSDPHAHRTDSYRQTLLRPYAASQGLPNAIIVDVDGTLTMGIHKDRGPFDWAKVGIDEPRHAVIDMVRMMAAAGNRVIVFSGRSEVCKDETIEWFQRHDVPFDEIHMRAAEDIAPDNLVKAELFEEVIRDKYNVNAVIDDRGSVVRLWHDLGLPLFRVGDPFSDF